MEKKIDGGWFTISIDFELNWGVRDSKTLKQYGPNILGGRAAIPQILALFERKNIHATWAIVGMLACENKDEIYSLWPQKKPSYKDSKLNPYETFHQVGKNEIDDPFHFGRSLVKQIADTPHMEIASHSFSHYYCLEPNIDQGAFKADVAASLQALEQYNKRVSSFVFCRNQFAEDDLLVLSELGFEVFRGNESASIYAPKAKTRLPGIRRAARFLDSYINVTGSNTVGGLQRVHGVLNAPSSRFLRPYYNDFSEDLKVRRILNAMKYASANNEGFHIWWHPHNFGFDIEKNLESLRLIIDYYQFLRDEYGMRSVNMAELPKFIDKKVENLC